MTSVRSLGTFNCSAIRQRLMSLSDMFRGTLCKSVIVVGLGFYLLYVLLSSSSYNQSHDLFSFLVSKTNKVSSPSRPLKTDLTHIVFGIAGSANTWPGRGPYIDLWWQPNKTRGFVWLDRAPAEYPWPSSSPPFRVSEGTERFRDYNKHAMPFAIRMVRVIIESFKAETEAMRWLVMADDDTVLFIDNLVEALGKYDHRNYFYIGGTSESISQNSEHSFEMAFGGASYAMSFPLAKALAKILDDCLKRYPTFYGSDHVIQACVAEIGVSLTRLPGFHQIDLHGDISGLLSAHPQAPVLSFHHLDFVDPIFPSMTRVQSLKHLMKAAQADSSRLLQQTVCYDKRVNWSFSISWGYSVQIYEKLHPPGTLQRPIETFKPWKNSLKPPFMFNTRPLPYAPCETPHLFFFKSVDARGGEMIVTQYIRRSARQLPVCAPSGNHSADTVSEIRVFSPTSKLNWVGERRECCEVMPLSGRGVSRVRIRTCMEEEVVA